MSEGAAFLWYVGEGEGEGMWERGHKGCNGFFRVLEHI